jgi:hypothetical protein
MFKIQNKSIVIQPFLVFLFWSFKFLEVRGQVIYLSRMFRIDEKLEFKSDNSTAMINKIPGPIIYCLS